MRGPIQRRRNGQTALLWLPVEVENDRGNTVYIVDEGAEPTEIAAWIIPNRSARAEVPGQQQVNVITMGTSQPLGDEALFGRVQWAGRLWDIVTPPAHHYGTRHVEHWTMNLRLRPS